MGRLRISSESLGRQHNSRRSGALRTTTMAEPLAGGDPRSECPSRGRPRSGRLSGHSTRWRALPRRRPRRVGRSRAGIITSADETRRIERDDHNPQPEGPGHHCAGRALDRVPGEPAYRLRWSSRPVITAEIPLALPFRVGQQVDQGGLDRLSRRKRRTCRRRPC